MSMCQREGATVPPCAAFLRSAAGSAARAARVATTWPGLLDVLGHHVRVGRVPVGDLHELAALHLPDLDEPAALVVGRRDLERRHQPAEGEVGDLLEAGLHVGAGDLPVRLGLERVADGLHVERGDEDAAVVEDGGGHLLRRRLALLLVHLPDLVQHRVVAVRRRRTASCSSPRPPAKPPAASMFASAEPHTNDTTLLQRIADALELLDRHGGGAAEQMGDHEVRAVALGDVEHLGAHLHARAAGRRTS